MMRDHRGGETLGEGKVWKRVNAENVRETPFGLAWLLTVSKDSEEFFLVSTLSSCCYLNTFFLLLLASGLLDKQLLTV